MPSTPASRPGLPQTTRPDPAAPEPARSTVSADTSAASSTVASPLGWRQTHLGRLLGHALRRFDERVLELMASSVDVPLALSNLAARSQVGAAHIHITRHLAVEGSRLTDLAASAGMSKQAMGDLVDQCEAWGLVTRQPDPHDKRARQVVFTATGLLWLEGFREAVAQAEGEFRQAVGQDVATVVALGLEVYAG